MWTTAGIIFHATALMYLDTVVSDVEVTSWVDAWSGREWYIVGPRYIVGPLAVREDVDDQMETGIFRRLLVENQRIHNDIEWRERQLGRYEGSLREQCGPILRRLTVCQSGHETGL